MRIIKDPAGITFFLSPSVWLQVYTSKTRSFCAKNWLRTNGALHTPLGIIAWNRPAIVITRMAQVFPGNAFWSKEDGVW